MDATVSGSSASSKSKCSMCGTEVDLVRPEEHSCRNNLPLHMPNPKGPTTDRLNTISSSMSAHRNGHFQGKLPKFAPSRIDPFAANEAFTLPQSMSARHLEPSVNNPPRSDSPAGSRFRMPPRSATTPHFRDRSPSPDLMLPQDSPFPLFPTKKVREERAKRDQKRSKSLSRSQSRDRATFRPSNGVANTSLSRSASPALSQFPAYSSGPGGNSSRKNSISSVRSRGENSIVSNPLEPVPPLPSPQDTNATVSPRPDGQPYSHVDPSTSAARPSEGTVPGSLRPRRRPSDHSAHLQQPSISAAIKPLDAIGSVRKINHDLGLNIPRSQSVSGHRIDSSVPNASFILETQSAVVDRRPSGWTSENIIPAALSIGENSQKMPEAAETEKSETSLSNLPSLKSHPVSANALARPRTSASSDGSSYSATHSISSHSSPPTSASSFTMHDNAIKSENLDNNSEVSIEGSKSLPLQEPRVSPLARTPAALQQRQRAPAKSFSRPNYPRSQLDSLQSTVASAPLSSKHGPGAQIGSQSFPSKDNRQSISIQDQHTSTSVDTTQSLSEPRSPPTVLRNQSPDQLFSPMSPRLPQALGSSKQGDTSNKPPRRPTTPGFKGNCRGCGEIIVGKSVSSADGRLAGRYHKQCFTCQTCKEPFQTVDFYVINNQPYCQRHYHVLNGSLCTNCDRGIEGPYMETEAEKKFHPHCFTCKECHLILRNDYFEVNGVIYCEKHSRKPDLLGPGRRFPERRTTRLMMM